MNVCEQMRATQQREIGRSCVRILSSREMSWFMRTENLMQWFCRKHGALARVEWAACRVLLCHMGNPLHSWRGTDWVSYRATSSESLINHLWLLSKSWDLSSKGHSLLQETIAAMLQWGKQGEIVCYYEKDDCFHWVANVFFLQLQLDPVKNRHSCLNWR